MEQNKIYGLIQLAKNGDTEAFRTIVETNTGFVYAVAFRMLANEEDARDTVQETFIKLWKNLNRYDKKMKLLGRQYDFSMEEDDLIKNLSGEDLKNLIKNFKELESENEVLKGMLNDSLLNKFQEKKKELEQHKNMRSQKL